MGKTGKAARIVKTIFRVLLITIVGLLFLYNVYVIIARVAFGNGMPTVFGYAGATVESGSMADEIEKGDFIITKKQKNYAVGDVVTFYDGGSGAYITHRIILVSGDYYATKGDANPTADDFSVPKSAVVGKVVSVWKGFGAFADFMKSPLGLLCLAGGATALWILADIVSLIFGRKETEKEKE